MRGSRNGGALEDGDTAGCLIARSSPERLGGVPEPVDSLTSVLDGEPTLDGDLTAEVGGYRVRPGREHDLEPRVPRPSESTPEADS
jgi:hypothetical protein